MSGYVAVAAVLASGVLLFLAAMTVRRLLAPRAPLAAKLTTYESGVDPIAGNWQQSGFRYVAFAFLYVVFAVDAVYLFPWATVVELYAWPTVLTMAVFLGILAVGLLHVWRAGVLRWR